MEIKKKSSADVSKYRNVFFNIGLALSISATLVAFEWKTYSDSDYTVKRPITDVMADETPITFIEPPPPPPPPKPISIIEVPEEEEIAIEELPQIDAETTELAKIPKYILEEPEEETTEPDTFVIVEQMPSFKGGLDGFYKFISKKVRYPSTARKLRIEGKVFVTFVIDKKGEVTDVKVLKGIGGGCDDEAIRVIQSSPEWNPGKQRGKPVNVKMIVPITFKLN